MTRERLSGWGRTTPALCAVYRPGSPGDIPAIVAGSTSIPRGQGRSYGDAAQNAGGAVIATERLAGILAFDPATGLATVEAGATLDHLMRATIPHGWFVAVTPGTRHVSVGGAIAADVHGKNHHHVGTFGQHVRSITVESGSGPRRLSPEATPAEFWATVGGMGLTGVIVEATLALQPVETSLVVATTERHGRLDALMAALAAADATSPYSVAWLDTLGSGDRQGRGLVLCGQHATRAEVAASRRRPDRAPTGPGGLDPLGFAPRTVALPPVPVPVLRPTVGRVFNRAWYRVNRPGRRLESIGQFFHPLDAVSNWNLLYGPGGFIQWQVVVPDSCGGFIADALGQLGRIGAGSFLSVLKRFGPANPAPLSFPMPGWTLAVDIPRSIPGLDRTLHQLDQAAAACGGRVYLAKDARLHPELVEAMYPRLGEWRAVRAAMDPGRRFRSDLSRRLNLVPTHCPHHPTEHPA